MNTLHVIEKKLKGILPVLNEKFMVKRIGVFGSHARGEAGKASDVDILVELHEPLGWRFVDLKEYLEEALGTSVDLVTINALKPELSDAILKEVVYA